MTSSSRPTKCIACSIFREELSQLITSGKLELDVKYINSMMHMRPNHLKTIMDSVIEKEKQASPEILLLYGECHNYMDNYDNSDQINRVSGCNCVEIFLGKQEYRRLCKDGAFFLLPEWTLRWREVFHDELDLKGDTAKEFMNEMHKYFLYLDTGVHPIPETTLDEITEALGLPWKTMRITTNNLLHSIQETLGGVNDDQ